MTDQEITGEQGDRNLKRRSDSTQPPSKRQKVGEETNGSSAFFPPILPGSSQSIRSEEAIRLMIQSLDELGLMRSAQQLREESQLREEADSVSRFKEAILAGNWSQVLQFLPALQINDTLNAHMISWTIHRHRFLETLAEDEALQAMQILKEYLKPLHDTIVAYLESSEDSEQAQTFRGGLRALTSLLVLGSPSSMKSLAGWPGTTQSARSQLIFTLHQYVTPTLMIAPSRLGSLLDQSLELQKSRCIHHVEDTACISLLQDHVCQLSRIPKKQLIISTGHKDEVWCLAFSPTGTLLATGGRDGSLCIWHTDPRQTNPAFGSSFKCLTLLPEDQVNNRGAGNESWHSGLHNIAWTSDGKRLLASASSQIYLWTQESDQVERVFSDPPLSQPRPTKIQCAVWHPDNQTILVAGLGQYIVRYNLQGVKLSSWDVPNVIDLNLNLSRQLLVAVCQEKRINFISLSKEENQPETELQQSIQETQRISSVDLSQDGRFVLVQLLSQEVHMWDIQSKKLVSHCQVSNSKPLSTIFLRASFGGPHDDFALSGTLEGEINIWLRSGTPLHVLRGHEGAVNGVQWNQGLANDCPMFASVGDDHRVILWYS